ncbi:MAG: hypothetical protein DDT40_01791 [candidate division WS2 bacterium]|nr:hypothetical protein [Candidatus Psychracetigena formicireducens]
MQGNNIRITQNEIQSVIRKIHFFGELLVGIRIVSQNVHPKAPGDFNHFLADASGADNAYSFAFNIGSPKASERKRTGFFYLVDTLIHFLRKVQN